MEKSIVVIKGDGIGKTNNDILGITDSAIKVINAAVEKAYDGKHKLNWIEGLAGEKAREINHPKLTDEELSKLSPEDQRAIYLPQETLDLIEKHKVAIKGPLATPIGEGFGSINVFLRKYFDLYACVRPFKYYEGTPSPNKNAKNVDMVIFRENIEDVYVGIEFEAGSEKQKKLQDFLINELGANLDPKKTYGLGIKPMSEEGTKRLVRRAFKYAIDKGYKNVTIVHKGNIMKYTEGAFRKWAYELAKEEFSDKIITEQESWEKGKVLLEEIIVKDRIADAILQLVQQRPQDYGVLACPNLNGDYLSDALAAMVGGLGISPGANIGDKYALFEATHGTAPTLEGLDKANPTSVLLSGVMLLEYLELTEAADLVKNAVSKVIKKAESMTTQKIKPVPVTCDIASQFEGYTFDDGVKCSEYIDEIINSF